MIVEVPITKNRGKKKSLTVEEPPKYACYHLGSGKEKKPKEIVTL